MYSPFLHTSKTTRKLTCFIFHYFHWSFEWSSKLISKLLPGPGNEQTYNQFQIAQADNTQITIELFHESMNLSVILILCHTWRLSRLCNTKYEQCSTLQYTQRGEYGGKLWLNRMRVKPMQNLYRDHMCHWWAWNDCLLFHQIWAPKLKCFMIVMRSIEWGSSIREVQQHSG